MASGRGGEGSAARAHDAIHGDTDCPFGITVKNGTVHRSSVVLAGTVGIQARGSNVFDSEILGVHASPCFESQRVLGPSPCGGTAC